VSGEGVKRAIDVAAAAAGIVMLAPLIAATALAVRVKLGSPVLFRQQRPGLGAAPFTLVKLRTMREPSATDGGGPDDAERMTALGRFLRSSSLDELPTLWNVLRGDMSLVGPRPLLMEYLPLYTRDQARRHEVRPGITGWAQVNGRNNTTWAQRLALDVWYVENRSLRLDLRILWLTVRKVLAREGINQPGQATMDRFSGNRN
jgi:lipopolysaccharide/colanic/teichoic acid biosynthesis glycosyltransferase